MSYEDFFKVPQEEEIEPELEDIQGSTSDGRRLLEMMQKSQRDEKSLKEKHQILLQQHNQVSRDEWSGGDDIDYYQNNTHFLDLERLRELSSSTPPRTPNHHNQHNFLLQTPPKSSPSSPAPPHRIEKPSRSNTPIRPGTPLTPLEVPESDGTPKGDFKRRLYQFMIEVGHPITKVPHLGYQELDIYLLYNLVKERGGMDEVTRRQEWKLVYQDLGIPTMSTSASYNTRTNYKKYLYLYEMDNLPQEEIEESLFKRNDFVRIVSDNMEGKVYYANILRMKKTDSLTGSGIQYYIHYNGWSSSHDEWMPEEVLQNLLEDEMVRPEYLTNPPPNRSSKSNYIIDSDSNLSSGGGGGGGGSSINATSSSNTPSPRRKRKEKKRLSDDDEDDDDSFYRRENFTPEAKSNKKRNGNGSGGGSDLLLERQPQITTHLSLSLRSSPLNTVTNQRRENPFSTNLLLIENRKSENDRIREIRRMKIDFGLELGEKCPSSSLSSSTDDDKTILKTIPIREILNLPFNAIINSKSYSIMEDQFFKHKNIISHHKDNKTIIMMESNGNEVKKTIQKDQFEERCKKLLLKIEDLENNPSLFLPLHQKQQKQQMDKKKDDIIIENTKELGDYRRLSSRRLK